MVFVCVAKFSKRESLFIYYKRSCWVIGTYVCWLWTSGMMGSVNDVHRRCWLLLVTWDGTMSTAWNSRRKLMMLRLWVFLTLSIFTNIWLLYTDIHACVINSESWKICFEAFVKHETVSTVYAYRSKTLTWWVTLYECLHLCTGCDSGWGTHQGH